VGYGFAVKSGQGSTGRDFMKRLATPFLLAAFCASFCIAAGAQRTPTMPQPRESRKADAKQRKAMKKYQKAQRKAQQKMIKTDRKNTHDPYRPR
jgi:hypothetical protein